MASRRIVNSISFINYPSILDGQHLTKAHFARLIRCHSSFLWNGSDQSTYTPPKWGMVSKAIMEGCLDIRDPRTQNQAAFAHLVWRFLNSPDNWWCKLLTQNYLCNVSFSEVTVKPTVSMGDGANIKTLENIWVPGLGQLKYPLLHNVPQHLITHIDRVKQLTIMDNSNQTWNVSGISLQKL